MMIIYCCQCKIHVEARLGYGWEVYPHREDLGELPFWICDTCKNFVGCHHKTNDPTRPMGVIPTKRMKALRIQVHRILDPLWRDGHAKRGKVYAMMTEIMGHQYHTGDTLSVDHVLEALEAAGKVRDRIMAENATGAGHE